MLVDRNWGLRGPALFFVCLFHQLLNDAQNCIGISHPRPLSFPKIAYEFPTPGPRVFPRVPLCFLGLLCLSSSSKAWSKSFVFFARPLVALLACVEVLSESRNSSIPVSFGISIMLSWPIQVVCQVARFS